MSDQTVYHFLNDLSEYMKSRDASMPNKNIDRNEFQKYVRAVLTPPIHSDNQSSNTELITKIKSGDHHDLDQTL